MEYLQRRGLAGVANFHLDSFNFATEDGLKSVVKNIPAVQVKDYSGNIIEISYEKADIGIRDEDRNTKILIPIYPAEARVQKITYSTNLNLAFCWKKNGRKLHSTFRKIVIPNMVKSKKCILSRRCDMQELKEDEKDPGGYFIINGMEYVIPLTLVQRRNHPLAIKQPFWKKRGKLFSEYGVSVHSVKEDQSSVDLVLHFVMDGSMIIVLRLHSRLIFIPLLVVLKALVNECDYFIYCNLLKGNKDDYTLSRYIKNMLRDLHEQNIFSDDCAKSYIGKSINYFSGLPKWFSTRDVGEHILKEMILVHLEKYTDKFNFLCYMVKKLWNLVQNKCLQDNMDNITNLEVLTSGHLYLLALKENMIQFLMSSKRILERKIETEKSDFELTEDVMKKCMMRAFSFSTDMKLMISTGNVPATKLGLKQSTGFSLLIQRLNIFRFISYFRRLQQGSNVSSFGNLCMRKMLPECWGFLCPIHTPSSEQIGLVNHATMNCEIVTSQLLVDDLPKLLVELGMYPNFSPLPFPPSNAYHVFLDGKIMGLLAHHEASNFLSSLKNLKVSQDKRVSPFLEIVLVPMTEEYSLSPGIYVFSTPGRMMRPVMNIKANAIEHIGVLEQAFLGIDLCMKQAAANATYAELNNMGMMSIVGSLVPFCEYNQSPRNIYACQMGKQAIGLPCHAFRFRGDTKLLQLWYPQAPLIKTPMYDFCNVDDYPIGTNAIVAVISYSGYDMEDAVCLNKSSVQRGFKRNCFFKNEYIDLEDVTKGFVSNKNICFGRPEKLKTKLDTDGLPYIGSTLQYGDPLFSYILDGKYHVGHFKYDEVFSVHDVRILGDIEGGNKLTRACITLRSMRVPEVGDKFASRHGQKGICGMLWNAEDLPFTSEGLVADILFNPHGFPTRMTIGMMIELMAGKSAALKCGMEVYEPFEFIGKKSPVKFFCEKLKSVGYNYYGLETMYSGTSGLEIEAHIFCGVVYYERLQQTVIDKYQVRSTGKKDRVTRQPIKTPGSAAIRFGEMERDSLISHGASYNLHDRFMLCSDSCNVNLCTNCGGLVYPVIGRFSGIKKYGEKVLNAEMCKSCGDQSLLVRTRIPYILVYLAAELSSVNIKIQFK